MFSTEFMDKVDRLAEKRELEPNTAVAIADACLELVCARYGDALEEKIKLAREDDTDEIIDFAAAMDASRDTDHDAPGPAVYIHVVRLGASALLHLAEMAGALLAAYEGSRWPSLRREMERWQSLTAPTSVQYVGVVKSLGRTVSQRLKEHAAESESSRDPVFGAVAHFAHTHTGEDVTLTLTRTVLDADDIAGLCARHHISSDACLALAEPIVIEIFRTCTAHGRWRRERDGHAQHVRTRQPGRPHRPRPRVDARDAILGGPRGHSMSSAAMAVKGITAKRPDIVDLGLAVANGPRRGYTADR